MNFPEVSLELDQPVIPASTVEEGCVLLLLCEIHLELSMLKTESLLDEQSNDREWYSADCDARYKSRIHFTPYTFIHSSLAFIGFNYCTGISIIQPLFSEVDAITCRPIAKSWF